jgi:hypothetical protein
MQIQQSEDKEELYFISNLCVRLKSRSLLVRGNESIKLKEIWVGENS